MRSQVLRDPALVKLAGRFVWLSIDSEREASAAFGERFPTPALPTFLVLDPRGERAVLRWLGSATAPQLERLLEDGERAVAGGGTGAEALLARADRLNGEGRTAEAIAAFEEALAAAPAGWSRRGRAAESLLFALQSAREHASCVRRARGEAPALPRGSSFANVAATGLACALALEGSPAVLADRAALEALVDEAVALPALLADDRSGLFELLVEARRAREDADGARALARRWLAFLEGEAARARGPEARAAFDPHRVAAAIAAGDPARALPALEASERELPADYNAPARAALVYRELGRLDEAVAALERALGRAYGPRRLRLHQTLVELHERRGDRAAALGAVDRALAEAAALPAPQRKPRLEEALRQARARLAAP